MVEKNTMSLLEVTIGQLLQKFPEVDFEGMLFKLPFESAVGEVLPRFKCVVCSCIAYPVNKGCARCFTYACVSCVATALKTGKECPNPTCAVKHAGKDFKESEEMHPDDEAKYAETEIECTDCAEIFQINDTLSHKKECLRPKFTCGCGDEQEFRDKATYQEHLRKDCSKVLFTCSRCCGTAPRSEIDQHRCHENLINKLAKGEIKELLSLLYEDSKDSKEANDGAFQILRSRISEQEK